MNDAGQFVLLLVRGFLLWIVIPLAALSWVVLGPVTSASFGACIGWFDLNLTALLARFLLSPARRGKAFAWVPLRRMKTTAHRVTLFDPV